MKAIILLATLKKEGLSNTQTLAAFLQTQLEQTGISCEMVQLVNESILPGTYSNMGEGDAWPALLQKITEAQILIFATPVWWGSHSSELQKVIERLDAVHDDILAGKKSVLQDKAAGIVITGDSDGAQHIIGNIANFLNAVGVVVPPYCTLSVLSDKQAKDKHTSREELMAMYEKEYTKTAETMAGQLKRLASLTA